MFVCLSAAEAVPESKNWNLRVITNLAQVLVLKIQCRGKETHQVKCRQWGLSKQFLSGGACLSQLRLLDLFTKYNLEHLESSEDEQYQSRIFTSVLIQNTMRKNDGQNVARWINKGLHRLDMGLGFELYYCLFRSKSDQIHNLLFYFSLLGVLK